MTVYFIGAGPGAADLITVRGARMLAACPVCLYAGAWCPRELLADCPPGARLGRHRRLDLDQIAGRTGRARTRRATTWPGCTRATRRSTAPWPSRCAAWTRPGVPYEVVPGVPAFAAAAAALKRELTVPDGGPDGRPDPDRARATPDAAGRGPRHARRAAARCWSCTWRCSVSTTWSRSCCRTTARTAPPRWWPRQPARRDGPARHARPTSPRRSRAAGIKRTAVIMVGRGAGRRAVPRQPPLLGGPRPRLALTRPAARLGADRRRRASRRVRAPRAPFGCARARRASPGRAPTPVPGCGRPFRRARSTADPRVVRPRCGRRPCRAVDADTSTATGAPAARQASRGGGRDRSPSGTRRPGTAAARPGRCWRPSPPSTSGGPPAAPGEAARKPLSTCERGRVQVQVAGGQLGQLAEAAARPSAGRPGGGAGT